MPPKSNTSRANNTSGSSSPDSSPAKHNKSSAKSFDNQDSSFNRGTVDPKARRRERNRLAASAFRSRKKEKLEVLETKVSELEEVNTGLRGEIDKLRETLDELNSIAARAGLATSTLVANPAIHPSSSTSSTSSVYPPGFYPPPSQHPSMPYQPYTDGYFQPNIYAAHQLPSNFPPPSFLDQSSQNLGSTTVTQPGHSAASNPSSSHLKPPAFPPRTDTGGYFGDGPASEGAFQDSAAAPMQNEGGLRLLAVMMDEKEARSAKEDNGSGDQENKDDEDREERDSDERLDNEDRKQHTVGGGNGSFARENFPGSTASPPPLYISLQNSTDPDASNQSALDNTRPTSPNTEQLSKRLKTSPAPTSPLKFTGSGSSRPEALPTEGSTAFNQNLKRPAISTESSIEPASSSPRLPTMSTINMSKGGKKTRPIQIRRQPSGLQRETTFDGSGEESKSDGGGSSTNISPHLSLPSLPFFTPNSSTNLALLTPSFNFSTFATSPRFTMSRPPPLSPFGLSGGGMMSPFAGAGHHHHMGIGIGVEGRISDVRNTPSPSMEARGFIWGAGGGDGGRRD
ncbi:Basic-leucine zipper domain [Phaffia rhodozyma]|uniref:Basic-leucine zipper domain n=1 Tax=Phaffia rhodozyma TaxID=264483 RepID=A0A0F7SYL9_PHARH|nr:Basic-leucine zipper domain [Phaffia rhodozyma]